MLSENTLMVFIALYFFFLLEEHDALYKSMLLYNVTVWEEVH